jgi:uncharacterized protein YecT (DUF1311 family)
MRRPLHLLAFTITIVLASLSSHAQEILSFEHGGREACTKALGSSLNTLNPRTIAFDCDERDLAIEKRRFAELAKSMEAGSPERRVAFNALMVSFSEFRDAHTDTEVCSSGYGCGEEMENQKAMLNDAFLHLAQHRIDLPAATADDATAADTDLNAAYQKAFASYPSSCANGNAQCVTQSALRDAERKWIRYRDTWLIFANLMWPQVKPEIWLTYLTRHRVEQIQHLPPAYN